MSKRDATNGEKGLDERAVEAVGPEPAEAPTCLAGVNSNEASSRDAESRLNWVIFGLLRHRAKQV